MRLKDLVARVSGESSIDKKVVQNVITSSFEILKESIESSDVDEVIFQSPVFFIRRKILPEVASTEEKEAIPARKRGIIVISKK